MLISIIGQEYSCSQSPQKMKFTVMAGWLVTVTTGNYFVSLINKNIGLGGILLGMRGADYFVYGILSLRVQNISMS